MGKVAGKRVTFGASARVGTIAASLAAAVALLLPTTALAGTPTEIGSASGSLVCSVTGFDSVQVSSSGNSYAVPAGGTSITSWSVFVGVDAAGAPATGPVGLEVWQPGASPSFTLIATDTIPAGTTLTPNAVNTFTPATPIPVTEGDLIGLRVDGPFVCESQIITGTTDAAGFAFETQPAVGSTVFMNVFPSFQLNIAASVDVTINPPPPPPTTVPTTTDQCKKGGWQGLTDSAGTLFKNQGDCVSFVASGGTNLAG
jgi:hypothetical protein